MIPVFRPYMDEEEKKAVIRVLESRWWGLGPETELFEKEFLDYIGANYGVSTNSGTAALHMALWSLGLREKEEVIVPSFTFVSSVHAVEYVGGRPIFADIDRETLTLDVNDVENKITDKTRAIVVVHYGGHPARMDEIKKIANRNNLNIIEDCAHAAGATYKGKKLGTIGDISAFSFHAVKNIATGDGGMVVFKEGALLEKMKAFRWVGITKTTWDRYSPTSSNSSGINKSNYDVESLGFKFHMNDIQAAIARVQLKRLENVNEKRRESVKRYRENLAGLNEVELTEEKPWARSSNHLFVILSRKRDHIMEHLGKSGISTSVHYSPVHLFYYYKNKYPNVSLPITEEVGREVLTLPLFPDLNFEDVDLICKKIKEVVK